MLCLGLIPRFQGDPPPPGEIFPFFVPESLAEKELSDFSPLWFLRGLRFYEGATTCLGLKSPGLSICVTACVMQATRRMPNGACSFHCCLRHGEWDVRERWICARW